MFACTTRKTLGRLIGSSAMEYRAASSFVSKLASSVHVLPGREAVRYTKSNMKWTAGEFKKYADSHANALIEQSFKAGDTIAVWLPESAEKHVTLIAAAQIGLTVVDFGTSVQTVEDLRQSLALSKCKAIFFEPQSETNNNLLLLRKAIPEFFYYDDTYGQMFHSKHFPHLKYFVHTGFDVEMGCLNYKSLFLPNPTTNYVDATIAALNDETPAYVKLAKAADNKIKVGPTITQSKLLDESAFAFAKKLVNKEYFETA